MPYVNLKGFITSLFQKQTAEGRNRSGTFIDQSKFSMDSLNSQFTKMTCNSYNRNIGHFNNNMSANPFLIAPYSSRPMMP